MSIYYDFRKCTVCRSNLIRMEYRGDFGVTMLMNIMYFAVIQQLEKPEGSGIKSSELIKEMRGFGCIIDEHGNEFTSDEIMKCLRNGLAHFNIIVSPNSNKEIEEIIIYAKKRKGDNRVSESFSFYDYLQKCGITIEDIICCFRFPVTALERTTDYIIDKVLNERGEYCKKCYVNVSNRKNKYDNKEMDKIKERV